MRRKHLQEYWYKKLVVDFCGEDVAPKFKKFKKELIKFKLKKLKILKEKLI